MADLVDPSDPAERERAAAHLVSWTGQQGLSAVQRDAVAAGLAEKLGLDYPAIKARRILQIMTAEEVKQLSREGVDFQLHTHRHRTPANEDLFRKEIRDNRSSITAATGITPVHFCYPSGAYRPEFLAWLRSESVLSATTCDTGLAQATTEPLLLPRLVDTTGRSDLTFESWLTGVGHFLSSRKRARLAYLPR